MDVSLCEGTLKRFLILDFLYVHAMQKILTFEKVRKEDDFNKVKTFQKGHFGQQATFSGKVDKCLEFFRCL